MTFPNLGPEAHEKLRSFFPFHLLLAAVLLIVVYMVGGSGVGDPDIWWHLKNAQYLFNTGKIPSLDMYSYTVAGQPWMNHEWLAEVPYYLAWRAFGLPGYAPNGDGRSTRLPSVRESAGPPCRGSNDRS